jgi:glucose/arabinose dehydrogenase
LYFKSKQMKLFIKIILFTFIILQIVTCKKDPAITNHDTTSKHLKIRVFVKNLENPWGMAFLPNQDFIFCERTGKINLKKNGSEDFNLIMFRNVKIYEGGLLGLTIDPAYSTNHYIYIYETVVEGNRVVRLKFENDILTQDQIILDSIPAANNHDGGALRFGPDGYLYVGTGDATVPNSAQDKNSLAGKILRIDRNGDAAPGNPFNSRVWTYGHRNVQGFDWNKQGKMVATEHGPTLEFGWCCHDEINLIEPGKNYGWPIAIGGTETDSLTPAIYQSGFDTWAPSGCTFIKGKEWGSWESNFIVGALKGQRLIRFEMNASADAVINKHDTLNGEFLRLRNIIQAPDGSLLFSTSNLGIATPPPLVGDDKIYQMYFE